MDTVNLNRFKMLNSVHLVLDFTNLKSILSLESLNFCLRELDGYIFSKIDATLPSYRTKNTRLFI